MLRAAGSSSSVFHLLPATSSAVSISASHHHPFSSSSPPHRSLSAAATPLLLKTRKEPPPPQVHFPLRHLSRPRLQNMRPSFAASYSSNASQTDAGSSSRELYIQHLLVGQQDTALIVQLQQRVLNGEDLDFLIDEHSICSSKSNSGIIGWVKKDQLEPEFAEAAFKAPLEHVVRCKTKHGWHLLRVLGQRDAAVKDIDPAELHKKMQDPTFLDEAQLVDVREPEEVAQASLPGFQIYPLRQFGNWGPDITTKLDPSKDTYVLCHHGIRSLQMAKWLQLQGFKSIYNIVGGIHAYARYVDPSIPTY